MRRIYVAGASSERLLVRELIEAAAAIGYEIACDWTRHPGYDAEEVTEDLLRHAALIDYEAVRQADVFWYVAPAVKSEGSATELGLALAWRAWRPSGALVVASGSAVCELGRIFPRLADRVFSTHAEALEHLREYPHADVVSGFYRTRIGEGEGQS